MPYLKAVALAAVLASLGGCAATPPAPAASKARQVSAAQRNPNCLRFTGSRIPPAAGQCEPGVGRIYSVDQIEQSGAFTVGEGLHRLIP